VCDGFTPADIAHGLRRALEFPAAERAAMIRRGYQTARSEVHPERSANDVLSAYVYALQTLHTEYAPHRMFGAQGAQSEHTVNHPPQGAVSLKPALTYRIRCELPKWNGLDVVIGTHQQEKVSGGLRLRLFDEQMRLMREVIAPLYEAQDAAWLRFQFRTIPQAMNKEFFAEFTLIGTRRGMRISLFEGMTPSERLSAKLARRLHSKSVREGLTARLHYSQRAEV
jgi:hypothetical protein